MRQKGDVDEKGDICDDESDDDLESQDEGNDPLAFCLPVGGDAFTLMQCEDKSFLDRQIAARGVLQQAEAEMGWAGPLFEKMISGEFVSEMMQLHQFLRDDAAYADFLIELLDYVDLPQYKVVINDLIQDVVRVSS